MKITDHLKELLSVDSARDAERVFNKLVIGVAGDRNCTLDEADAIIRSYLGYFVTDHEQRLKIEKFYSCEHPYFGKPDKIITPQEAYKLGMQRGKELANEQKRNSSQLP